MTDYSYVKDQLDEVIQNISLAAQKSGRNPEEIKLVAVTKTFPPEAVMAAYEHGHRSFGENRVQELASKKELLPADIEWHLIGHLQSNKAVKAVGSCKVIHSVDSEELIRRLNRISEGGGGIQSILLEVNVSGEDTKFGIRDDEQLFRCVEVALISPHIKLEGLMTMAPFEAKDGELRKIFSAVRELRSRLEEKFYTRLPELSMGMSSDYFQAIAEGATIVRIGTAIFGKRA